MKTNTSIAIQLAAMTISGIGAVMVYAAAFKGSPRVTLGGLALCTLGGCMALAPFLGTAVDAVRQAVNDNDAKGSN